MTCSLTHSALGSAQLRFFFATNFTDFSNFKRIVVQSVLFELGVPDGLQRQVDHDCPELTLSAAQGVIMATGYLAIDPRFQRDVAIKVLPRQSTHAPRFLERFSHEAQTIAALEHAAIVPVHDFGAYPV